VGTHRFTPVVVGSPARKADSAVSQPASPTVGDGHPARRFPTLERGKSSRKLVGTPSSMRISGNRGPYPKWRLNRWTDRSSRCGPQIGRYHVQCRPVVASGSLLTMDRSGRDPCGLPPSRRQPRPLPPRNAGEYTRSVRRRERRYPAFVGHQHAGGIGVPLAGGGAGARDVSPDWRFDAAKSAIEWPSASS
jgi:hypothetical protein